MGGANSKPKILVSIDESQRAELSERVPQLLSRVGVTEASVVADATEGLLQVWFPGNPQEPLSRLTGLCESDPELFRGTHQWTPVEAWTLADEPHLSAGAERLARRVSPSEPFHFDLRSDGRPEFEVGGRRPGPDPLHPGRTLRVDIVGRHAALSLLEPGDVLDVDAFPPRARRGHDESPPPGNAQSLTRR